jgi:hypothetical protein
MKVGECLNWLMFLNRVSKNPSAWHHLSDPETIRKYSYSLHSFAKAILSTLDDCNAVYKFPLTEEVKTNARTFQIALCAGAPNILDLFHEFIFPVLSARSIDGHSYSKWEEPLECWLAIHCLSDDGSFLPPSDITQVLAKMEYHCRSSVLYQSIKNVGQFNNDISEYVLAQCSSLIFLT